MQLCQVNKIIVYKRDFMMSHSDDKQTDMIEVLTLYQYICMIYLA